MGAISAPTTKSEIEKDDINLSTPAFFGNGDPHEIWRRHRTELPIHLARTELKPYWSLTRYDDVQYIFLNDDKLFSLQRNGPHLPAGPQFEHPDDAEYTALIRGGQQLAGMEGQPHSALRRYFSDRFSPTGVRSLEQLVRRVTNDALDDLITSDHPDFTTHFGGRVPVAVIAAIMDIPKEYWEDLYQWNNMLAAPDDPEFSVGTGVETSTFGLNQIMKLCVELAEERRGKGGDDLLTALTEAEVNGKQLSGTEIGFNGLMFFAAGHETTRSSMSTGMLELIRDPAQFAYLREHRNTAKILRTAADEFVRYSSPLTHQMRTATQDIVIGGQSIKEGERVVGWLHAANRDPAVFDDPERFDVKREKNPHLGFGVGKHFCLGAHLAKLDMQIMLEALLSRLDDIQLAGPVEMSSSNLFWGIKHMPISFKVLDGA